jgi:calcineurin-like phosphoesterase family protein
MKTYFTSDLHFGHANIIKYCNRPFESSAGMDEGLIANFNARVRPEDVTYFLGDMFFCDAKRAIEIMHRLNGMKRLVLGNHDKLIRNQVPLQNLFDKIYPDLYEQSIDGIHVVMCHYPLLTWNRAYRGAFMLHGHSHNTIPFDPKYRRLDVGVDAQGYAPIAWEEIKRKLEKIDPNDVRDY